MMYARQFAEKMLSLGRAVELSEMVRIASTKSYAARSPEHESVYTFTSTFMIAVAGQLRLLEPGKTLDDDDILRVWNSLGLWGLNIQDIADYLDRHPELETPDGGRSI